MLVSALIINVLHKDIFTHGIMKDKDRHTEDIKA